MKTIVQILTEQTQSLKQQYISKSIEWANKEFDRMSQMNFLYVYPNGEYIKRNWGSTKAEDSRWNKIVNILNKGKEQYLEDIKKGCIQHYEQSIVKLALRIEDKRMNLDKLQVETSHIGVNINTTLTDGEQTVRAFTVLAWGAIQRPHYRYLIK